MIIDSTTNPTVKALRALEQTRQSKARRQFLVEGVRAVEDALRAGAWPEVCLYNPDLLRRTARGTELLAALTAHKGDRSRTAPLEASERALEAAATTQHPQGVVAAFRYPEWDEPAPPSDGEPLALVCDSIQDPGNLGTIFRTAEAAGVHAVFLSPQCVDMFNPKVVRAAMGAHFRLPIYDEPDWKSIAHDLKKLGIDTQHVYATEVGAPDSYDAAEWYDPSALIVSNEAHGASAGAKELAGGSLSIPMLGNTESLNAATATAIILFEAARQRRVSSRV